MFLRTIYRTWEEAVREIVTQLLAYEQKATTDLTDHIDDTTAAHAASAIANTPAGDIAATDVQAAINELDTEKSSTSHTHAGVYEPADADIAKLDVEQTWTAAQAFTSTLSLTGASSTMGFGAGSGGTVTQATNKSTGVTLNKSSGQITMNNAALGAGASVFFTFSNSLIAAGDTITLNANNALNYSVRGNCSAGSVYIVLKNESAGSLSDAVVITFKLAKGATA